MSGLFILNSVLLGVGLAMDAFSVSLANGLANHFLRIRTMCFIAGTFGFFQWLMPMTGWVCVNRIVDLFQVLLPLVPWASLVLLVAIG
ncbi:MAG: manganese efflux pump, partial [Dialister sp.]|nr:manganese efflux pump [Dialister sp.]